MSQKQKNLVGGVAILSVAGLLAKVIGMFFRVPLSNMIGSSGMGIYSAGYNTYSMLLTISTSGIPVAISRLVSENVTIGRHRQAHAILRTALLVLAILGTMMMLVLIVFSRPLALRIGDGDTALGFAAIAPSILLVSLMSALRGYMQGHSRMAPTAVSQLIEQLAKVAISYPLAAAAMRSYGVVYAAAAALLGITIGEGLALAYMVVVYALSSKEYAQNRALDRRKPTPKGKLAWQIIRIAVPITIGSMIVPLSSFIDTAMIINRLVSAGFAQVEARSLYGMLTGFVLPLVNVPTVLATAVCVSLVPSISAARIEKRYGEMRRTSRMGLRLSALIGYPCAAGMSLLSTQIIMLLYPSQPPHELMISGQILSISAWTILLFTHVQASTGILQGAGYHKIPVYSLVAGVVCKIILNFVLIGIPGINIFGAPVASIVCYGVSMVINIVCIVKKTRMRFDWGSIVFRPALATAGMAVAVVLAKQVLDMTRRHNTVLAVAAGGLVYIVLVFVTGTLKREDMAQIPGGSKIEKLMLKLRIWR